MPDYLITIVQHDPQALHKMFYEMGIQSASLNFGDDWLYEYLNLGEHEFQLFRVGDVPTNFVYEDTVMECGNPDEEFPY